jgi:3'(2'), 5'-bisphosphate nucleotidase
MFKELLPQVVNIAISAGDAIMQIYADPTMAVTTKADDTPLTQADLASDRVISAGLAQLLSGWPVLTEESAQTGYIDRRDWKNFWLIDPLDGTKEFISRNGEFTVNIALIERGEPVLGVVYAPALDVCYFAARGVGAYVRRGAEAAHCIRVADHLPGALLNVVASRSHRDSTTEMCLEKLGEYQCVSMGSSLKFCLVAEGVAHLYLRTGPTMEWDTAAAHAVVKYAGGTVIDFNGNDLHYNKPDLHNPGFFVISASDEDLRARLVESMS